MQVATDLLVKSGAKAIGNVPGFGSASPRAEAFLEQWDNPSFDESLSDTPISVIERPSNPVTQPEPKKARRKRKRKPGKRGPKGSTYLTWEQVKDVDQLAHLARREGHEFNRCITVRAPKGLPDAEGKRAIDRIVKHIGQALRDRGQVWLAVWVYEKSPHLHAHVLVYVAPENLALVKRRHEGRGGIVHVRSADRFGPQYVTKQRRKMEPEFERAINRPWRKSARIEGPRLGYSTAAKALVEQSRATRATGAAMPPKTPLIRLIVSNPIETLPTTRAIQGGLPLDWVPSRPPTDAALMAQFCEVFGYTQEQAATRLGYRDRSHVANILRGHDGMSPSRRKWLQYLLETGLAA